MPDWRAIVRGRMESVALSPAARNDVIAELSSHLEDQYDGALAQGMTANEAEKLVSEQAIDWARLCRGVQMSKEDEMTNRARQVLIPGMITLAISGLAWQALYMAREALYAAGIPSPVYGLHGSTGVVVSYPWLALLPFLGAFAAWWSRRMGGNSARRLIAASFPALVFAAIFIVFGLLLMPFVDRHVPLNIRVTAIGIFLLGWTVIPGAFLTLGALPFLGQSAEKPQQLAQSAGS